MSKNDKLVDFNQIEYVKKIILKLKKFICIGFVIIIEIKIF